MKDKLWQIIMLVLFVSTLVVLLYGTKILKCDKKCSDETLSQMKQEHLLSSCVMGCLYMDDLTPKGRNDAVRECELKCLENPIKNWD